MVHAIVAIGQGAFCSQHFMHNSHLMPHTAILMSNLLVLLHLRKEASMLLSFLRSYRSVLLSTKVGLPAFLRLVHRRSTNSAVLCKLCATFTVHHLYILPIECPVQSALAAQPGPQEYQKVYIRSQQPAMCHICS